MNTLLLIFYYNYDIIIIENVKRKERNDYGKTYGEVFILRPDV